jgi:RNase P subunit RPR2
MHETHCRCEGNEKWNPVTLTCEECGERISIEYALQHIESENMG